MTDDRREGWQPIKTAKKARTPIWLYAPGYPVQVGRWYDENVPGFYGDGIGPRDIGRADAATHWQRYVVPSPPAAVQDKG